MTSTQVATVSPTEMAITGIKTGTGPLTQSLPPELLRVLASGLETAIVDPEKGGGVTVHERMSWEPCTVDDALCVTAVGARDKLLDNLRPIEPDILGAKIGRAS